MAVENKTNLDPPSFARIESVVATHHQLLDVLNCEQIARDSRLGLEIVIQDEYTHDVIVSWGEGSFLVYDTN
ncbi:MAG: hypothetical protein ABI882_06375 [Acidobacteriota bacterium]